jgi:hypothetical protein
MSKIDGPASRGIEHRVARLLDIDDVAFLREAYLVTLGRGIDRDGEAYYGQRLKANAPRGEILRDLAGSAEGQAHLARSPKVAAALMALAGDKPVTAGSVDELLALPDREFVESAVRLLLDQGTDIESRNMLLTRLRGGTPRYRVLVDVARKSGRVVFPDVAGLDDLLSAAADPLYPTARSLAELFALHDEAFVDAAYKTLLRRAPDFKGLAHYVGRLREGFSRSSVLHELARSSEGRARAAALPGLGHVLRFHRVNRLPLVGGLIARSLGVESDSSPARRARQLTSLVMRNHALQAQVEGLRANGLSPSASAGDVGAALVARQDAMIDIQRDSFEREINGLRKLVVQYMDGAQRPRERRSPARPATRRAR